MKTIFKNIAICALALASASCLDLSPKDQLSDPDLWDKPGDFESFANKFYDWMPSFSLIDGGWQGEKASDLIIDKGGVNNFSNGTNTIPESDGDYTGAYSRIRRCCLLIERAKKYPNVDEIRQSLGEAYFWRAWNHFVLVQKFGDAIIVDKSLDVNDPLMSAKRNDRGEVVDFIIDDLKQAASLMKSTSEIADGRVGKEGALAFLSRVALFEGTWQKFRGNETRGKALCAIAADAAKKVIESQKFELFAPVALGDSAQKYMFILEDVASNPAGLNKAANHEYIIKRCYHATLKTIGINITWGNLANAALITAKLPAMYLCSDGLPTDKSPLYQGTATVKGEWQNRDNRMRYTLMRPGDNFWSIQDKTCRIDWSSNEEELKHSAYTNFLPNWGSGYFPQKWCAERQCVDRNESYDFPVLRYAEVLLNYAEAVYEANDAISDEDLNMSLNLTRTRINKKMPVLSNSLVSKNGLNMRQEIRRERTVELFYEGHRITDLRRWKTAETEMPQDMKGILWEGEWKSKMPKPGYQVGSDGRLVLETGRTWEQKHYLHPLPVQQLQLNPNLGQNPGW